MVINVQKYLSSTYNIPINMLKGKINIKSSEQYKIYNLSILLSWLLHPTQVYGSKSLIARFHSCNKNRVYRLFNLYNKNSNFKSFVDKELKNYKVLYASN
jgi:hypothetical protein